MTTGTVTQGAGEARPPVLHLEESPSAKYLLFAAWVMMTEGALALVFLPVLVFSTKVNIPPGRITMFGLIGVLCLGGGGAIYLPRRWGWWVALFAAIGCAGYLYATSGLTSVREAYVAIAMSVAAVILLLIGRPAAGQSEWLALASARLPFRLKVGIVWVAIFFMLGLFLALSQLDFEFIKENFSFIFRGLEFTILLAAGAIVLATFLALLGALGRLSHNPVAFGLSGFYTSFFRGTPLIVQLFLLFYALPQIGSNLERVSISHFLTLSAFLAGLIGLGLNYGAYMTEIFRAGIQSVGHGQAEAADALGMSYFQRMRRVVLPQATRVIIPPTGNEFIAMMKDTALVSILAGNAVTAELFLRAQYAFAANLTDRLESLIVAAGLYWGLTSIFTFFQVRLERRISKGYVRTEVPTMTGRKRVQLIPASGGGQGGGGGGMLTTEDEDGRTQTHGISGTAPSWTDPEDDT